MASLDDRKNKPNDRKVPRRETGRYRSDGWQVHRFFELLATVESPKALDSEDTAAHRDAGRLAAVIDDAAVLAILVLEPEAPAFATALAGIALRPGVAEPAAISTSRRCRVRPRAPSGRSESRQLLRLCAGRRNRPAAALQRRRISANRSSPRRLIAVSFDHRHRRQGRVVHGHRPTLLAQQSYAGTPHRSRADRSAHLANSAAILGYANWLTSLDRLLDFKMN